MPTPHRIGTLVASVALAVPPGLLVGGPAFADPGGDSGKGTAEAPGQQPASVRPR